MVYLEISYMCQGLYGKGDLDSTVIISTRCGQDSDCNPSNAAGVLFTTIGYENLPERFKSAIDLSPKFSFTDYNFPELTKVCEELARQAVSISGGKIEKENNDDEWFYIPIITPQQSKLEQCWQQKTITEDIYFTDEEIKKIKFVPAENLNSM